MISRVAEHCFWLARYLERAENTSRVLEVNQTLLLDFHIPSERQWLPILIISGIHDVKPEEATAEWVQHHMTWDEENAFSIMTSINWARENARIIREMISIEMWERMNFYHLWIQRPETKALYNTNRPEFYSQIRRINQLFLGICEGTMSHGEAWQFIRLGTYLERACQTARILDVKYHYLLPSVDEVGSPIDHAQWVAILMSCSGYEPFHKKVRVTPLDPGLAVAEFLIFDDPFPRSLHHCLTKCRASLDAIGRPLGMIHTKVDEQLDALIEWLDGHDIKSLILEGLHESLTRVVDTIHDIGAAIHETYFTGQTRLPTPVAVGQTQSQS